MSAIILTFPVNKRPSNELNHDWRSDVPPFDPSNPAHRRAWEGLYDYGRRALAGDFGGTPEQNTDGEARV